MKQGVDTMKKYNLQEFIEKVDYEFQLGIQVKDETSFYLFLQKCRELVLEKKLHIQESQRFDATQFYTVTSPKIEIFSLFLAYNQKFVEYGMVEIDQYLSLWTLGNKEKRKIMSLECDDFIGSSNECILYASKFSLQSDYPMEYKLEVDFNKNNLMSELTHYFIDSSKSYGCPLHFQSIRGLHPFTVDVRIADGQLQCEWSREVLLNESSMIASVLFLELLGTYELFQKYPIYFYTKDK